MEFLFFRLFGTDIDKFEREFFWNRKKTYEKINDEKSKKI